MPCLFLVIAFWSTFPCRRAHAKADIRIFESSLLPAVRANLLDTLGCCLPPPRANHAKS